MKLEELKKLTDKVFKLDIANECRKIEYIKARAVYFYICRKYFPNATLKTIGESIQKDHATVINMLKKHELYLMYFPSLIDAQNKIISLMGVFTVEQLNLMSENKQLRESIIDLQLELLRINKKSSSTIGRRIDNLIETTENKEIIIERLEAFLKMNK